jgi:hypothetical protein
VKWKKLARKHNEMRPIKARRVSIKIWKRTSVFALKVDTLPFELKHHGRDIN